MQDLGPFSSGDANTVPNGGVCNAVYTPGDPTVTLELSGIDTSLTRRPTELVGTRVPIPASDWWVSNKALVLWSPLSAYPLGQNVTRTISLAELSGVSVSGQPLQNLNTANDSASYDLRNYNEGTAGKIFTADFDLGAPYSTACDPGNPGDCLANYIAPGQLVRSQLRYFNLGTQAQQNVEACDVLDRTAFDLAPSSRLTVTDIFGQPLEGYTAEYGVRSGGPYFASTDSATSVLPLNVGGTSDYTQARCSDPSITWYSSAAAAEAAGGVTYVRVKLPVVEGNVRVIINLYGLRLRPTYAATIAVQSPPDTRSIGAPLTEGTLIRNQANFSSPDLPYVEQALFNDHIQVVTMKTTSRLTKSLVTAGVPGQSGVAQPGALLDFQLLPSVSTTFPPQPVTATVTDILPPGLSYVPGSATQGAAPLEPAISENDPATGYTRLTWTLPVTPSIGPSQAGGLPELRFSARLDNLTPNDSTLVNSASISAGPSDYEADCVYSVGQGFGTCAKADTASVTAQTTAGFRLQKSAPVSVTEPGQSFAFEVAYASFGRTLAGSEIPEIIDILPYVGDGTPRANFAGRTPPSQFGAEAYQLTSVVRPGNDPALTVLYTAAEPQTIDSDPRSPSNAPGGSTRWCAEAEFGQPQCPATLAAVTAVRLRPSPDPLPADTVYTVRLNLQATGAAVGSVFSNSAGARAQAGELLFVETQAQPVRVVASGLRGQVFVDTDQDGVLEPADGDIGIAGVCMTVQGGPADTTFSVRTGPDGRYAFVSGAAGIYAGDCSSDPLSTFGGLRAGTYTVTQAQPSGYLDGRDYAGNRGGTAGNDTVTGVTLTTGQEGSGYNFTELPQGLSVSKTVSPRYVRVTADPEQPSALSYDPADRNLTYTLRVRNAGAAPLANVTVTDRLPEQVGFSAARLNGAALTPATLDPLTFNLGTLAPLSEVTLEIDAALLDVTPGTDQTAPVNRAAVRASGLAPVYSEDAQTDIVYTRLLKRVRSGQGTWETASAAAPKTQVEYCLDFANYSSVTLAQYQVTDSLPPNTEFVAGSATVRRGSAENPGEPFPGATADLAAATGQVTSNLFSLPAGGGEPYVFW
ncbi:hypothetical protein ACFP81_05370 [Deinococcus lacus]|uniref:DUF11 domain-containing protein n=1 Tax=Deinococcus lacus TaxID=392561 RepID=A0ABW1YE40_9DEIO